RIAGDAPRLPVLINALITLGHGDGWGSTNANAAALTALSGVLRPPFKGSTAHTVHVNIGGQQHAIEIGPDAPIAQFVATSAEPGDVALEPNDGNAVVARLETSYVPAAEGSQVAPRANGFVVTRELLRIAQVEDTPPERIALSEPATIVSAALGDVIEDH